MNPMRRAYLVSLAVHAGLLLPAAVFATAPATVAVTTGQTSIALVFKTPKPALPEERGLEIPLIEEAIEPEPEPEPAPVPSIDSTGAESAEPRYAVNTPPEYPRQAYLKGIEGTVIILAEVNDRGVPTAVAVERSSGSPILDQAATRAVRGWLFSPAIRLGFPVASRCRIPIHFRIEEVH